MVGMRVWHLCGTCGMGTLTAHGTTCSRAGVMITALMYGHCGAWRGWLRSPHAATPCSYMRSYVPQYGPARAYAVT